MTAEDLYVLPENVEIIPVKELSEQAKSKFEYSEDDFVLTYTNTRNTSKVINHASASLLREFRSPKSLVEGVYRFAVLNKLDPAAMLEESYTLLADIRNEGFMVRYEKDAADKKATHLNPGEWFKDYQVLAKIQGISDTQVYKVRKGDTQFALKIIQPDEKSPLVLQNFHNEIEVLRHLDGKINPVLIEHGEEEAVCFMVVEWCDGAPGDQETAQYRDLNINENVQQMLAVSQAVLTAYQHLHGQGIIHGDIHPRNILIGKSGEIKIIDFGLARFAASANFGVRGGIGFYYEPEYAAAIINKQPPVAATIYGEQYALAALIYFFFTGQYYLNFSFEQETLLRQIIEEPPIPFLARDIDIDDTIEQVIFKGLAKKVSDRYVSAGEFATEFMKIRSALVRHASPESKYSFAAFGENLKQRFGIDGKMIKNGLQQAPNCSVNYGNAGIAYMLYRMASIESDPALLATADIWANRAAGYFMDNEKAFYSTELEITRPTVGTTSIYHTAAGVHLVQALISYATGNQNTHFQSVMRFLNESDHPCENLDITLGKASTLLGCALLYNNLSKGNENVEAALKTFGNKIQKEIWNKTDTYGPLADSNNPITYRGIAHGWAGILYATLKWSYHTEIALPTHFFDRLDELMDSAVSHKDQMRWNLTATEKLSWPGWCHGSAGYVFLWTLLYKYTADKKYVTIAEKTARHFLEMDKEGTNGSLCCGLAGEAYALLSIFNITRDDFYLQESKRLSKRILQHIHDPVMKKNSLYKGDIGIGVLFTELQDPAFAVMPLFE